MIEFEWPWIFLALPLPLLVRLMSADKGEVNEAALRVAFAEDFVFSQSSAALKSRASLMTWMAWVIWLLLVIATARPVWIDDPVEIPISGRDLMLAVDLSGSMEREDFELKGEMVNRLVATKVVAGDFIERRVGDRVGKLLTRLTSMHGDG